MNTRTFSVEELEELGVPFELDALADEHVNTGRWNETRRCVFRAPDDGRVWGVNYDVGLTEYQECEPFEYQGATVKAVEMEQYTVTVQRWRHAGAAE